MEESFFNNQESKEQVQMYDDLYINLKKESLILANNAFPALQYYKEQISKSKDEAINVKDFIYALKLEFVCKYLKMYGSEYKQYFLDLEKVDQILHSISSKQEVMYLNKYILLQIINTYFDLKIQSGLINKVYGHTKNRVETNMIYTIYKEAITRENGNSIKDPLRKFEYNSTYDPIKKIVEHQIAEIIKASEEEMTRNDAQKLLLNMLSSDMRKIEKTLFPLFYDCIILKKNLTENTSGNTAKRVLLFDLFPFIIPEKEFFSAEEFEKRNSGTKRYHNGRYYNYKNSTIKSIIDK